MRSVASARSLAPGRLEWLPALGAPAVVAVLVTVLTAKQLEYGVAAAVGAVIVAVGWRRPTGCLVALAVFLPLEPLLFGLLLGGGVPASALRAASAFKEAMVASLVVAAVVEIRQRRHRLDGLDQLLFAYVAAVTIYLIVPHLFSTVAPSVLRARVLAWRSDCGYVMVFFAARHAPIPARGRQAFFRVVAGMGGLTAAVALFQRADPHSWQAFLLGPAHQVQYLQQVLHQSVPQVFDVLRYVFVIAPLHVGSIFLSPYDMSDYLLLSGALALEHISRNRQSVTVWALLAGVVAALYFSRVRSDALALLILLLIVLLPNRHRTAEGRLRLVAVIVLGAALIVPSLSGSRFVGAQGGAASSNAHVKEVERGISLFEQHPLGIGLGAQPGTAVYLPGSNGQPTNLTTDNAVTQTAVELGVQGLVPWLLFLIAALVALWKRSRSATDLYAGTAFLAVLGILIAGQFHHVFIEFPVPWTLWAAAGLALPAGRRDGERGDARVGPCEAPRTESPVRGTPAPSATGAA